MGYFLTARCLCKCDLDCQSSGFPYVFVCLFVDLQLSFFLNVVYMARSFVSNEFGKQAAVMMLFAGMINSNDT